MAGKGFSLIKRKLKRGSVYYYRLNDQSTMKTTGCSNKYDAAKWVEKNVVNLQLAEKMTVRQALEPFFTGDCPHVKRLRTARKSIGDNYIRDQRRILVNHVFDDVISKKIVGDLSRNDFLELQKRLNDADTSARTINRIMQVLKIAFRELHPTFRR